jgi:hypothetical protein
MVEMKDRLHELLPILNFTTYIARWVGKFFPEVTKHNL